MIEDRLGRLERILARLEQFYGPISWPPREAFPHFLWQVLWLQTTAQGRDGSMLALRRIPALTPDSIAKAAPAKVEAALLAAGAHSPDHRRLLTAGTDVFRRKRNLDQVLHGPIVAARRALSWLGPLNPAVSGWMLLFAGDHPVLPLDGRMCRVAWRLGWGEAGEPVRRWQRSTRHALRDTIGSDLALLRRAAYLLAHHGASACDARSPRCGICPLRDDCPGGQRGIRTEGEVAGPLGVAALRNQQPPRQTRMVPAQPGASPLLPGSTAKGRPPTLGTLVFRSAQTPDRQALSM
jgi:endonuclease-3